MKFGLNSKPSPAEPPQRTPERQKLADAIAELAVTRKEVDELAAADRGIAARLSEAREELAEAKAAFAEAKAAAARSFAATAAKGGKVEDISLDATRNRVARAEEVIELLEVAQEDVRARLPASNFGLKLNQTKVTAAATAVIATDPDVAALIEEFRRVRIQAYSLRAKISPLSHRLGARGLDWEAFTDAQMVGTDNEWAQAVERLTTDADAPFPEIPR